MRLCVGIIALMETSGSKALQKQGAALNKPHRSMMQSCQRLKLFVRHDQNQVFRILEALHSYSTCLMTYAEYIFFQLC